MFKISVSVPRLARQMLFECGRNDGASFALYDEANSDHYRTLRQNIIGQDRRQGDTDPNKAIIGGTAKVRGNSSFGRTIMDKEKFQNV